MVGSWPIVSGRHADRAFHSQCVVAMTCLLVLLAAVKSPTMYKGVPGIEHAWDQAISILENQAEQVKPAREAVRILRALKQHIQRASATPGGTFVFLGSYEHHC